MVSYKELKNSFVGKLEYSYTQREKDQIFFLLLEHFFEVSKLDYHLDSNKRSSELMVREFMSFVSKLNRGYPVQYLTNRAFFRNLELYVDDSVLIPRPETEELVELVLKDLKSPSRVIDLGTGSGCIPLSIKDEHPQVEVIGIDLSEKAITTAIKNKQELKHEVTFSVRSMTESLIDLGEFDVVVSNPPYIGIDEKESLEEHVVQHEPNMALFSTSKDPLFFYKEIYSRCIELLKSNGRVYLELHENYAQDTFHVFNTNDFRDVEIFNDLQGKQRFLVAKKG